MRNKLFVTNLTYSISDADLEDYFKQVGSVLSAKVIKDRDTGRSRGFGFVEMETEELAKEAQDKLNGTSFNGREIIVREALPKE